MVEGTGWVNYFNFVRAGECGGCGVNVNTNFIIIFIKIYPELLRVHSLT